jgi:hypothetical protein
MRYKPAMVGRCPVWVAVCAAVAACGSDPVEPVTPTGPAVAVTPVTTGPTTLPSPPVEENVKLVLVSAGAEPRQALRYRPRVGSEHIVVLDNHTDMTMSSNGHRMFDRTFDTTTRASIRIASVEGDRITLEMTVLSMDVPNYDPTSFDKPPVVANKRGTFVVTDRGKYISSDFQLLDENAEVRDALQISDYQVLLPEEPVGIGATWEVHTRVQRNGIGLTQIDTHELIELGPNSARTRATLVQNSWPQVVNALAEDPLTVFEVDTFKSTGSSEGELAFDQPLPKRSTFKFQFSTGMPIRRPEGAQAIELVFNATLSTRNEGHAGPR